MARFEPGQRDRYLVHPSKSDTDHSNHGVELAEQECASQKQHAFSGKGMGRAAPHLWYFWLYHTLTMYPLKTSCSDQVPSY